MTKWTAVDHDWQEEKIVGMNVSDPSICKYSRIERFVCQWIILLRLMEYRVRTDGVEIARLLLLRGFLLRNNLMPPRLQQTSTTFSSPAKDHSKQFTSITPELHFLLFEH